VSRDLHLTQIHIRETLESVGATVGDVDSGAVHVELVAVTGDSDPGPGLR
jgi:hypothetical protein